MRSVQRSVPLALIAPVVAGLVAAPAAVAAPKVSFDVRPAAPHLGSAITVTVTAPRLKPGTVYKASIDRLEAPPRVCAPVSMPVTMRRLANGRFTATLRPHSTNGDSPIAKVWCPGAALLRVERHGPGHLQTVGFAKRATVFARGRGEPVPPPIPARAVVLTLLEGSTLTAWAPGRPDRVTPVTGTLSGGFRQSLPSPGTNANPITTRDIAGTLALPSLAADPLCPGSEPPRSVAVDGSSTMAFDLTGNHLTLVLRGQPTELIGCGAPGSLTGTTALTLSAPMTAPVIRLPMTGVLGDLVLPGGTHGGITANFVMKYELTNRWLP